MSARVRWECPNGCGAVLAPSRPRADDVRRYCLPCSAKSGRLVRRSAPALERKRQARRETAAQARKRRAEAKREAEARRYVVETSDGRVLDLRYEMDVMFRGSRELRDRVAELFVRPNGRWRPELTVHRGGKRHSSGHAYSSGGPVHVTIGAGSTAAQVRETLLHELVHAVLPTGTKHGSIFRATLCRAARELYGTTAHPDDERNGWSLDRLIETQMGAAGY